MDEEQDGPRLGGARRWVGRGRQREGLAQRTAVEPRRPALELSLFQSLAQLAGGQALEVDPEEVQDRHPQAQPAAAGPAGALRRPGVDLPGIAAPPRVEPWRPRSRTRSSARVHRTKPLARVSRTTASAPTWTSPPPASRALPGRTRCAVSTAICRVAGPSGRLRNTTDQEGLVCCHDRDASCLNSAKASRRVGRTDRLASSATADSPTTPPHRSG